MSSSSANRGVFCTAAYVPRPPYCQSRPDSAGTSNLYNSVNCEGKQNYAGHQRSWSHQKSSSHHRPQTTRLANLSSISSRDYRQPLSSSISSLSTKRWVISSGMTRRLREFIPEFKKDREYWQKRFKNNEAAKRSREKRRITDVVMGKRIFELASENKRLRLELDTIKRHFNLALNVRFDHEPGGLSPKCATLGFLETPMSFAEITTINDDTDDVSSLLVRKCPGREYDLSRCVETDLEFSQIDAFENYPTTVIGQSNENKLTRGYRRLTSVTNIQDEMEKFDRVCTSSALPIYHATSNSLLTQCYNQGREMNNNPMQFKQKLPQLEQLPTCGIERLPEVRLNDALPPQLTSVRRSDYADSVMTSSVSRVLSVASTTGLNADDLRRRQSQSNYNRNDGGCSFEKQTRFSFDEKNGTSFGSSIDNTKNSHLPCDMVDNSQHLDFQLPYDQRVCPKLEVSHDNALELVNISSDEEEVKYSQPMSVFSLCSAIPAREGPLNLSKRSMAATMHLPKYNKCGLDDFAAFGQSSFNRKAGMFYVPSSSQIANSSVSPAVSLHSVAPLSTNKSTMSLPPIVCMTSPIPESRSNNSQDLLQMPPLSRIAGVGPLPTISTLTASHTRRHLPEFPLATSRHSGFVMSDFQRRITTLELGDLSVNLLGERDVLEELHGSEVMNKHVRGGVPLKVWHKLASSVIDGEQYSEITPLTKSIEPSILPEKWIVSNNACGQKSVVNEPISSSSSVDNIRCGRRIAVHSNYTNVVGNQNQLRDGLGESVVPVGIYSKRGT